MVEEAFAAVRVPGRLEVIGRHPLVVVDGAHNVAGMLALARSLVEEFAVDGEAQAVVGMLTGRDPTSMLEALLTAGIRSVVACAPDSPRALPAEVVAEAAARLGMEVDGGRLARRGGGPGRRPGRARRPDRGVRLALRGGRRPAPAGARRRLTGRSAGPVVRPGRRASASLPRSWDEHLVICKPDAVERGLVGEIIGRLERKGLRLVAAELRTITAEVAGAHYAEHGASRSSTTW